MKIRLATRADAEILWEWANSAREWSLSSDPIPWHDHVLWFEGVLDDPNRTIYVGESDGLVGSVRFDRADDQVEVSITVAPGRRGEGLGRRLLDATCEAYGPAVFVAQVKIDNVASMALFRHWEPVEEAGGIARFLRGSSEPQGSSGRDA